jgi:hypothetical protein
MVDNSKQDLINHTTYTDSALSDRFRIFLNRFKEDGIYKYVNLIDTQIIQSRIVIIDYNNFTDELKSIFADEPKQRNLIALYRAIGEVFQTRFQSEHLDYLKHEDLIKFRIQNNSKYDSEIFSNPKPIHHADFDVDKTKTVDADSKEFSGNGQRSFDAYEIKNQSQHFAKDFVSDIMLPAHSFNGKESCGKGRRIIGCIESDLHPRNNGGYIRKIVMHCNHKGCKICASTTMAREARSITNRLLTFTNLKKNRKIYLKENRSRILSHNVISVPFEEQSKFLTKDGRAELKLKRLKILNAYYDVEKDRLVFDKKAKEKLIASGKPILRNDIDGGVMIDHPYRFTDDLESAYLSPHYHSILAGWIDGKFCAKVQEKTGWVISNISTLDTWIDCYSLSKYLLSHSAVYMKDEDKRSAEHSVVYFGECQNTFFKVESVLKHSATGNEQLDVVLLEHKELEKKITQLEYDSFSDELKKYSTIETSALGKQKIYHSYKLQKVSFTHSIIDEKIKDATNEYFEEYINGNIQNLCKSLRRYIKPMLNTLEDNPANPQSDHAEPSMEFLQMRFDYGISQYDIVQSAYVNIILDTDIDCICPECSLKMQTLAPAYREKSETHHEKIAELLVDMPDDLTLHIDNIEIFDYLKNVGVSVLGMPYFDLDGKVQYDNGVYQKPDCLDELSVELYCTVVKSVEIQKAQYEYKVNHGRSMSKDERSELLITVKQQNNTKPLDSFQSTVRNVPQRKVRTH